MSSIVYSKQITYNENRYKTYWWKMDIFECIMYPLLLEPITSLKISLSGQLLNAIYKIC